MVTELETWKLIFAGGSGAFIKDILKDNKLVLPKKIKGTLVLGSIGGLIIGACVGYLVDNDPTTAFFAGYAGSQILVSLVPKTK